MRDDDTIKVPAMYEGIPDALLSVDPDEYGDSYTFTLRAGDDGHVIASASGFRPGAAQDFGTDHPEHTVGTFGAFLAAALEDADFAAQWEIIGEEASEWADALLMMEETGD